MRQRVVLLALLALGALWGVQGLFEDQARRFTWHQEYVGRVTLARTEPRPRSRLYVATEKNVLAALAAKDGAVLWRKVFGSDDAISHLEVDANSAGSRMVTLSEGGRALRVFDGDSGRMLWQAALPGHDSCALPRTPACVLALSRAGDTHLVVVALGGSVQAFNVGNGRQQWTAALPVEPAVAAVRLLGGSADQGVLTVAALQPSQQEVVLVGLSVSKGEELSRAALALPHKLSAEQLALTPEAVVGLTEAGTRLCAAALSGTPEASCLKLASLLPQEEGVTLGSPQLVEDIGGSSSDDRCPSQVVLRLATGSAILSVAGGKPQLVTLAQGADASGCINSAELGPVVALSEADSEEFTLEVVSAADGASLQKSTVPRLQVARVGGDAVGAERTWLLPFRRPTGKASIRPLVLLEEHTLALLPAVAKQADTAQGHAALPTLEPIWLRTEALAGVVDALMVDLPAPTPEHEAQWLAAQPGLGKTVATQLLALKAQFQLALTADEEAALAAYRSVTSDQLRPTRDPDGFRKQIVVATEAGKVAALHTGDGHVLWSLDFGAAAPRKLVDWVIFPNPDDSTEVGVLHPSLDAVATIATDVGELWAVQTIEGDEKFGDAVPLPGTVKVDPRDTFAAFNATAQPEVEPADQHVYALVPEDPSKGSVHLVPDSPPAWEGFRAGLSSFSFWRAFKEEGVVRGYGVDAHGDCEERWSVVVAPPGSGLAILEVAAHEQREAVQSHAKVLGDGSLKFKYLNPNTLLVAVGPLPLAEGAGAAEADEPRLTVLLLDGVTGRVLASQAHEGARGPVHAVLCEHWAVYHYWNAAQHRWQMSVLEVYDASQHDLRVVDLAFGTSTANVSSWDATPLEVLHDSFYTKLPVMGLDVTRTARGITARQILMSTPTGQVYMMDKRFLDPRRPRLAPNAKPTPEQQAEGLVPYAEELPYSTLMFATGDKQVRGLRGLVQAPSAMESTTLLFAHGLDLFYTRLAPSRTFDLLPDDFPFALLVLIVVAMTVASSVLSSLNRKSALKKKWE